VARRLAVGLIVAGLALLGVSAYRFAETRSHQASEQRQLEAAFRQRSADPVRETGSAVASRTRAAQGKAWGRLEIGRVGLSVALEEGIDEPTLRRAVGHVPTSPFPGEGGNVALAGHRDSLFRPLREVQSGDLVRVTTLDGVFEYHVDSLEVVPPERTDVLASGPGHELTLVTCYPFSYVGPAPLRYIVKARASSTPRPEKRAGLE
jgi:sortase A